MITLYKGDDTQGQLGKKCIIKFHCDDAVDMTNVTVRFNLLNIVTKEFTNVNDGDKLEVFVSHIDSRKLPLGIVYGKLWGEDSSGKIRTFANRIPFKLTTDLRCVYGSDGLDSVDVHVYSSVDWDAIANKPTLFPSKVSMVEGLEEALKQAGKVKTVNGQSPDANGNIEIELPSCKVTSVNNKTGDVELAAQDIPYGGEGASNVETAIEQNTQAIGENAEAIDSLEQQVGELQTNTYTKSEVDDKINQSAAHYLTKRTGTEGHYSYPQFATHADLAAAKAAHTEANPQFFYGAEGHTPDKNDYCVVLADETHNGSTTRYAFVGEWDDNGYFRYQYTINQTAFTEEQWAAINSLTSVDEDGNLCFDGIPFINSSGELLFTEEDPIFTAWKNEVQIILGSGANIASGKYKQIAIGTHATANGQNAIALGSSEPGGKTNGPRALAQNAIAIGAGANATATNAVQILAGTNNKSGTIQLGNKVVAFLSDIPISQADIDDYRYYKGHWEMGITYMTGDIVRAERTVEGQEEKEVVYFKSLRNNNLAQNPFSSTSYWSRTTDDEGLEKLTLFVKAAIAGMTGADIPVSKGSPITISSSISALQDTLEESGDRFEEKRDKTDLAVYHNDGYTRWKLEPLELSLGWTILDDDETVYDSVGKTAVGIIHPHHDDPKLGFIEKGGVVYGRVYRSEYAEEDYDDRILTRKTVGDAALTNVGLHNQDFRDINWRPPIVYFAGGFVSLDMGSIQKDFVIEPTYTRNESGDEVLEKFRLMRPTTGVSSRDIYVSEFPYPDFSFTVTTSHPYWVGGRSRTSNSIYLECEIKDDLVYILGYYEDETFGPALLYGGAVLPYNKNINVSCISNPLAFLGTEDARNAIRDAVRGQIAVAWANVKGAPATTITNTADAAATTAKKITLGASTAVIPAVVAPASDTALRNKAADAYETGNKLPLFFSRDPAEAVFRIGSNGEPVLDQFNYEVRYHFPASITGDVVLALVSQLSGITAQDITDFLKYKGCQSQGAGLLFDVVAGDIFLIEGGPYARVLKDMPKGSRLWEDESSDEYVELFWDATDGFLKLVELYGKNKALLFSDTAFIEAVKKYGAPQYKKDENGEWYQEVEI